MSSRARPALAMAAALVTIVGFCACSGDDDNVNEPGGSPPTLHEETLLIDPTPTTMP
jgi:hypothetical protein